MTTILRFLQYFSLGTWVGAILFLAFIVAPAAFSVLAARDQAGALVGRALSGLHFLGYAAGGLFLFSSIGLARGFAGLARPASVAVILMLLLTAVSQHGVSPRLAALRAEMGSVDATPQDHPLRVEFGRLHGVSTALELFVLLGGVFALFQLVRTDPR